MIRAIPIVVIVVALAVVTGYIYSAHGPKAMVLHIHPHLSITLDGRPITIPSHIGIDYSLWKDNSLNKFGIGMAPLHTHDTSGTIHDDDEAHTL